MKTHSKILLDVITCPFAVDMKNINWDDVVKIASTDDKNRSVIVIMNNNDIFLVKISQKLYDAIYKSGEENVIEQDVEYYDLN
jgi:hypothetical protein